MVHVMHHSLRSCYNWLHLVNKRCSRSTSRDSATGSTDALVHLVSCRAGQRLEEVGVGDYANLAVRYGLSEALDSSRMGKQYMMARPPVVGGVFVTGSMRPDVVPHLLQNCTAVSCGEHMAGLQSV